MSNASTASRSSAEGSIAGSWPALVLVAAVILAAVLSFSHRPLPPFAPTQVHRDQLLVNGLAQVGERFVAVGEQGRILVATDPGGPWSEAKVEPQRGSTFTQVVALSATEAVAVGHDGWIVRTEDGGQSWKEVAFTESSSAPNAPQVDPLLGVAGPYDGKLFAFGAFGRFLTSTDGGRSWNADPPVEAGKPAPAAAPAPAPAAEDPEADPFADPFANVPTERGLVDHHFNAMTRAKDGALMLVGERGLIARSTDLGATWTKQEPVYGGSYYGALTLPSGEILIFGMRGNTFVSRDHGLTWIKSEVPLQQSLFGGAVLADGTPMLVGAGNTILVSKDRGESFVPVGAKDRKGLAAVLPLDGERWLTAGEGGIGVQKPAPQKGNGNGAQS